MAIGRGAPTPLSSPATHPLRELTMAKTATFGVMHLGIAFGVTYALTGNVAIAGAITFIEPLLNTVAHYFFDRHWDRPGFVAWRGRTRARMSSWRRPATVLVPLRMRA
jgi:uncharacterized membrane protein